MLIRAEFGMDNAGGGMKDENDDKKRSGWLLFAAIGTGFLFWGTLAAILWFVLTR